MFTSEREWQGEFIAGTRLRSWDRENKDLDTGLASGGEIYVFIIFGEL